MKKFGLFFVITLLCCCFVFAGCTAYGQNNLRLNEKYYSLSNSYSADDYKQGKVHYIVFNNNSQGGMYSFVSENINNMPVIRVIVQKFRYTIVDESSVAITYQETDNIYVDTGERVHPYYTNKIYTYIFAVSEFVIMNSSGNVYTNETYLRNNGYLN